jgi:hypothetical protein
VKLFYLSAHIFVSVCLSVLARWKQLDRYVSTIPAAVSRVQSAQPRCKTKTR